MEYSGYEKKHQDGKTTLYQADCMKMLPQIPDKYYQLCIVDPPYGGGNKEHGGFNVSRTGGTWNEKYYKKGERHTKTCEWDVAPIKEYFDELFRVSQNQIIWGGNYFQLPPTRCFVVWRKLTISEEFSMAMCEYAWTSFDKNAKWFECAPQDTARFHPTQKPVALYKWLLKNYAKKGDKILDTHLDSGSSAIAADIMGFDFVGIEIDEDYYKAALDRFNRHKQQLTLEI